MAKKGLRNAALLGGAALLASQLLKGDKKGDKKDTSMMDELEGMDRSKRRGSDEPTSGRAMSNMEEDFTPSNDYLKDRKTKDAPVRRAPRPAPSTDPRVSPSSVPTPTVDLRAMDAERERINSPEAKQAAIDKAFGNNATKALEARNARKEATRRAELPTGVSFPANNPRLIRERAEKEAAHDRDTDMGMKKGGMVKKTKAAPKASSASKRGDGIAQRGKTKGRMI